MKYNIYKSEMEYATTYHYFNSVMHSEAIKEGFVLVTTANTQKDANRIVDELYG